MDQQNMMYTYNGILAIKGDSDTCYSMDVVNTILGGKKADTERNILWFHLH